MVHFLQYTGFCDIQRVENFNLDFRYKNQPYHDYDSSTLVYANYFISLNLIAKVCPTSKPDIIYDGFAINHAATSYRGPYVNAPDDSYRLKDSTNDAPSNNNKNNNNNNPSSQKSTNKKKPRYKL
jgi:hypothetical protein